ncbi:PEP-CTERM sorting domain-containing protein [Coraliomargarita sp. SDUM461004]|uniref:PEP-CTERM sorting domain-containing protein n=1 Tax=Thalassobacterium sedimentorum TaxID=3041258 RepID=A0ABU1AIU0_9BACT|nr:PEP-CTERM sorting domain-containing protein [Coraliomargarita sp. SDUM461004]MDQ8194654.1 PEP-CTERM sorting domain-containing protein [Coraliomargarita sp. SDUM461004]
MKLHTSYSPLKFSLAHAGLLGFAMLSSLSALSANTVIPLLSDARITDDNENGSGNFLTFDPPMYVGDSSNNKTVFSTAWRFDITSFSTEISDATSIIFQVEVDSLLGDANTVFPSLDFLSLDTPDSGTSSSDYQNNSLLGTIDMSTAGDGTIVTFDVTNIVKSATTDRVGFILKIPNATDGDGTSAILGNNENGAADLYIFVENNATLSLIPEPSSFALFAGSLCLSSMLLRRRAKR